MARQVRMWPLGGVAQLRTGMDNAVPAGGAMEVRARGGPVAVACERGGGW